MANIKFAGLDEYMKRLSKLDDQVENIEKKAIYEAASIVADAVRTSIDGIRVESLGPTNSTYELNRRKLQKKGLQDGMGVSKMENDNGFLNVKVGFDGYNDVKTKKHPNGQANMMIARAFNSGTSFNRKQPFFDQAVRSSRKQALNKMESVLEEEMERVMK